MLSKTDYNATLTNNGGVITIIHPFLPNKGKVYAFLKKVKLNGKYYIACMDESNQRINIPIEYTDFNECQENAECDFLVNDLMTLFELIESIEKDVY